MREPIVLMLSFIAGIFLGIIFFGGLWWTVRRGLASNQPALWFAGSMLLRTAIAVFGFYCVMQGDWRRLVSCVAGFLLARVCTVRLTRKSIPDTSHIVPGGAA